MKNEYVIAMGVNRKNSGYSFTKGKAYKVLGWFGKSAEVLDDDGKQCFVAVGLPTLRLDDGGTFEKVEGWRINQDGYAIQSKNYVKSAVIGDTMISSATISDGQIYASATPRNEYAEVLEQLREILRVPEGENILTHAKVVRVLADGLINLQK